MQVRESGIRLTIDQLQAPSPPHHGICATMYPAEERKPCLVQYVPAPLRLPAVYGSKVRVALTYIAVPAKQGQLI